MKDEFDPKPHGGFAQGRNISPRNGLKRVHAHVSIDPWVKDQAEALAKYRRVSLSNLVEDLLRREIELAAQEQPQTMAANRRRT